jgi:hypothetical protein
MFDVDMAQGLAHHPRMAKDLTAIRIDGKLIEALKRTIATAPRDSVYHERSVNWMIQRAVEEFVERLKGRKD